LHAQALGLIHPYSGEALRFECALPEDMVALLDVLEREDPVAGQRDQPRY
jgi:hypothetical protein